MRRPRLRLLWLLVGLVAVAPLLAVDPSVVALLLDPELLAVVGGAGLLLLRTDLTTLLRRALVSTPVLWVRVGWRLSRGRPGTLLA